MASARASQGGAGVAGSQCGTFLVIIRAKLDVLDWPDEASLQAIAARSLPLAGPTLDALRSTIASIRAATLALDQVEVNTIDRETADQALMAIAEPLRRLGQLQRVLTLRRELSRRTRAEPS